MAAFAVAPPISVDEYLRSVYEPDMDFVDGVLEDRNSGEFDHAELQSEILTIFHNNRSQWQVKAHIGRRVQVAPTRFRVPDVCVISSSAPQERIVRTPPLLCIEILSPKDRFIQFARKRYDYIAMGVPEVWVFNPTARTVDTCLPDGSATIHRAGALNLAGTAIELHLADIFKVVDENRS